MKFFDNGSLYTVTVERREVEVFAESWPCSGLRDRAISFCFDKGNGDLIDLTPYGVDDGADGSAVSALAQGAGDYGRRRLKLAA